MQANLEIEEESVIYPAGRLFRRFVPLCLLLLTLSPLTSPAVAESPAPPQIDARGHLLVDIHSRRVLSEHNAAERMAPASLTKIMTAYVVFHELRAGNIKLDEHVTVSEKAWRTPGSKMFIEVGKRVRIDNLLRGMIVQSGNDASVALAERVAGAEDTFARLMNEHATRLGMLNTHFVNATGLPDDEHFTTPADIAMVTEAMIREFPDYYAMYAEKEFEYNDISQRNRNLLLWRDPTVDGVKTGHTESAGYCLVASAKRQGMRLISVVMGTGGENERAKASQALLDYGFRFYETHRLYGGGSALTRARAWKGEHEEITLGIERDLYVTIPRGQYQQLEARTRINQPMIAPIRGGQALGALVVDLANERVAEVPLIALADNPKGGIWRQALDTLLLMLE